jgi:hypothetical protein
MDFDKRNISPQMRLLEKSLHCEHKECHIFLSWLLIFSYACNNSLFNVCVYSKHFICTVTHILLLFVERLKIEGPTLDKSPTTLLWDPHGRCVVFVSFNKVGTWIFKSMPYKHLFSHKHKPKKNKNKNIIYTYIHTMQIHFTLSIQYIYICFCFYLFVGNEGWRNMRHDS